MRFAKMLGGCALVALTIAMAGPAAAQQTQAGDIDFGDDSGVWARDGECDDPRFVGEGASGGLDSHLGHDATDCREAFEAGTVTLSGSPTLEAPAAAAAPVSPGDPADADGQEVDFGDDTGQWANDGECDDPRFEGPGIGLAMGSHRGHDATDCREAFEAGTVTLRAPIEYPIVIDDIDFGDDSGEWPFDGECDDPRFRGSASGLTDGIAPGEDATDCSEAYEAGTVTLIGEGDYPIVIDDIDFGDDSGDWAFDGECDDPRFVGEAMGLPRTRNLGRDATDCSEAYQAGTVTLRDTEYPIVIDDIDFGDDSGDWAFDGECDDPRFTGPGASAGFESHLRADATDCSEGYEAGTVTLLEEGAATTEGSDGFRINFGDDSGDSAFNGVCDDPRFEGRGAADRLYDRNRLGDATDCRAAYEAGTVTFVP